MKPFFSIGIPIYNEEKRIVETIKSIQMQNFKDFEIICVDDCSSDSSYEVLKKIAILDDRVKIFRNESNLGIANTRKRVCSLSEGKYFLWCDSDDRMEEGCLSSLNGVLKKYNDKKVIVIQNAQINNCGVVKEVYSCRTQVLNIENTARLMAIGNTWYSYPWTIVGTTELFKDVNYPANTRNYVDDQLASHCYLENADTLIYLDKINYTHYLYQGSDSHNASFYKRLSNTYKYLKDSTVNKDSGYWLAISMMEKVNLAWYYAKLDYLDENREKVFFLSKECRALIYLKSMKWLECKYRIISVLFVLFPGLFYKYYNHRKLL